MRTLDRLVLVLAQNLGADPVGAPLDLLSLVLGAGILVKMVLVVLLLFTVASWSIILSKHVQFRRTEKHTAAFLNVFRTSNRFSEVHERSGRLGGSPLVGLFQAGYTELNTQLHLATEPTQDANPVRRTLKSLEALDRALLRASTTEAARLEHRVSFLATTASITPYIGLFGTVIGIITAFQAIASSGQTSLGAVAPGIAEALVATAAGLLAAIPAVYYYNALTGKLRAAVNAMENFSMEFLTIAERNFS